VADIARAVQAPFARPQVRDTKSRET
jgi:hypothetical protein